MPSGGAIVVEPERKTGLAAFQEGTTTRTSNELQIKRCLLKRLFEEEWPDRRNHPR
ncbi:hypothetical protein O9992_08765 [Vibrio lentus]|nr:hypothetical protein [Vibrio lentus]